LESHIQFLFLKIYSNKDISLFIAIENTIISILLTAI